jgi:hypothetical protein
MTPTFMGVIWEVQPVESATIEPMLFELLFNLRLRCLEMQVTKVDHLPLIDCFGVERADALMVGFHCGFDPGTVRL